MKPACVLLLSLVLALPAIAQQEPVAKVRIGVTIGQVDEVLAEHLNLDPEHAILFSDVLPGHAADRAGIERHDILLGVGDEPLLSFESLRHHLMELESGDRITLKVLRRGDVLMIPVEVEPAEAPALARANELLHEKLAIEQYEHEIAALKNALAATMHRLDATHQKVAETTRNLQTQVHEHLAKALHHADEMTAEEREKIQKVVHLHLAKAMNQLREAGEDLDLPWLQIVEGEDSKREAIIAEHVARERRGAARGAPFDVEQRLDRLEARLQRIEQLLIALQPK